MSSKSRFFGLMMVVVAILTLGATGVFAQDSTDPTPPCPMWSSGFGMMDMTRGGGMHMMWDGEYPPMWSAVAEALGIDVEALRDELQSGATLADLAEQYGVDLEAVTADLQAAMQAHLSELVDAGIITQAQADAHLSQMAERWDEMPMLDAAGFGMMRGGRHHGMWGNGGGRGLGRRGG